jgi:hypothetical protein
VALPSTGADVEEGVGVPGADEAGDGDGDVTGACDPGAAVGASPHAAAATARPQRRDTAASLMKVGRRRALMGSGPAAPRSSTREIWRDDPSFYLPTIYTVFVICIPIPLGSYRGRR